MASVSAFIALRQATTYIKSLPWVFLATRHGNIADLATSKKL
jgi:hypothetical protein